MRVAFAGVTAAILALGALGAGAQMPAPISYGPYTIPDGAPEYIRRAIESDERSAEEKARDSGRKPAEILMMSGIRPGDHVIEFAGIGQYYTKLLSAIVGPNGKVDVYDLPYTERFAGEPSRAFAAAHPNTTYHQEDYNDSAFPPDVDVVFNVLYYHDLILQNIDTAKLNGKLLAALKPGGRYVIIDHKAEDGSGTRDVATIHRIDAQVIEDQVTAAGFELVQQSDILAHPEDDRSKMVFSAGTRGGTDRAVFIFRKPE